MTVLYKLRENPKEPVKIATLGKIYRLQYGGDLTCLGLELVLESRHQHATKACIVSYGGENAARVLFTVLIPRQAASRDAKQAYASWQLAESVSYPPDSDTPAI